MTPYPVQLKRCHQPLLQYPLRFLCSHCDYVKSSPMCYRLFDHGIYCFPNSYVAQCSETIFMPALHLLWCMFECPSDCCTLVAVAEYCFYERAAHVACCAKDLSSKVRNNSLFSFSAAYNPCLLLGRIGVAWRVACRR